MVKCSINYKINVKKMISNILIAFAIFSLFRLITVYELGKEEVKTYSIIVNDKDTLWNIAGDISKKNNMDIQKVIYDIQDVNHMSSSNIYKGQTLLIPIYH
ncbi:MAG: LysM peptidoglycan-binding domain-containing protein [Clostridia bacterium]|nr:LysM peptidoglycan-binding domain-containing protein [Clostridia bacterium]